MTEADKDLKEIDEAMAKAVDKIAEDCFGRTKTRAIETHTCVSCGGPAADFKDETSMIEWRITGFCQKCQDEIFNKPCCESPGKEKCDQCQEIGLGSPLVGG